MAYSVYISFTKYNLLRPERTSQFVAADMLDNYARLGQVKRDIARLGDTAAALHARYWVVSDDDFELDYAGPQLETATAELLQTWPVVFESADGAVRIHAADAALSRAAE